MKTITLFATLVVASVVFLAPSNSVAQHALQLDDGAGHYSVLQASASGGAYLLPNGGGTLLTSASLATSAWVLGGNVGVGAANKMGTLDNTDVLFVSGSGGPNTRMQISSTGLVSIGGSSQFQVSNTGNLTKINNVATSFPSSQGAANSVLSNDGAGNLSWIAAGSAQAVNSTYTGGSAISAHTDNLSLSTTATYFRMSSTGNYNITGIDATGAASGRVIIIGNIGANFLILKNLDAGSASANQFDLPGAADVLIGPNGAATLIYDLPLTKWKLVSTN